MVRIPPPPPGVAQAALAVSVAVAFADSSIVVLALPELYGELDTTVTGISWVVTAYNVVVAAVALALVPFVERLRPVRLAVVGLGVFLAASIACALANGLGALVAARSLQGVGAALLLAASLPLLVWLAGSRARGSAVWTVAGTLGVAVGPALGGLLTELFSWRAIFVVQAPVAAVALLGALHPRVRDARPGAVAARGGPPLRIVAPLALAFAALVGALFLAVLLVVTVLDYGPLAGAGIVSALPLAALAVRPLVRDLAPEASVLAGAALLAAGLGALALPPTSSLLYVVPALAIAGAGLGLALPPLTRASLPAGTEPGRAGAFSVGARHVGLVLGLVAVAPLLAAGLDDAAERATLNGTAVILDAPLPLSDKIPVALDLYREFQRTPEGEVPDLSGPFDERGADDADVRRTRDTLLESVEAALARGFRSSFAVTATFALLAGAGALGIRGRIER